MRTLGILLCLAASVVVPARARAEAWDLRVEGGAVWFSRSDVRIPGDGGTTFDMLDVTGPGPNPYLRLHATCAFHRRHALRLTVAPLETEGTGCLSGPVTFMGDVFAADTPTTGTYRFNTWRLTYRWMFYESERWRWGVGAAALVRDAAITLEQGGRRASRDDLGLVPLLHLSGACRIRDRLSLVLDLEGAWSPTGRAVDAALQAEYVFRSGWYVMAGYRTLEGGADTTDVYTFAWLHHALAGVGYRF